MSTQRKQKRLFGMVAPSTLAFFKEGLRQPGYSLFDAIHGYIYGRFTYFYIGLGVGEHPLNRPLKPILKFAGWAGKVAGIPLRLLGLKRSSGKPQGHPVADGYHGKVVPLQAATRLVQVNEPVKLRNLETIIPYSRARDIVLKNPEHLAVIDCPCRSSREDPCLPLDVCLIVGEPFTSFVLEHHAGKARAISQAEAVEILKAEDERGHVHHAFFKDAMLGRFYAICNCCACCCGAIHAHQHGNPMLASSGYLARVDPEICIACGECQETCQFGALEFTSEEDLSERLYGMRVGEELCMGCGVCVAHCSNGGISLHRAAEKGEPLEIHRLLENAV